MPFKITKFPQAEAQIRALAKAAVAQGVFPSFSIALKHINEHLTNRPLEWGDPEYNLKHPDGVVCHGIESPLLVHFAVYETERVVCLLDIEVLPNTPLGNS